MNKQEFQQTIKNMKCKKDCVYMSSFSVYQKGFEKAKELALLHSNSLDESEKPVVPQFVADWIEWCKKNKITLLGADTAICNNKNISSLDASGWAMKNQETFAKAWLYGYEIEKEKLYTVEIPNPNGGEYGRVFLGKYGSGKVGLHCWTSYKQINFDDSWKKDKIAQLTEAEIKEDFEWAWQFAEEVEE